MRKVQAALLKAGVVILVVFFSSPAMSDERAVLEKLRSIGVEADGRNRAFMALIDRQGNAIGLDRLSSPEYLATPGGRAAIRRGYVEWEAILDKIDTFSRAEEALVKRSVADAVATLPMESARDLQSGFERGYSRSGARYKALYDAQRKLIHGTFDLLDAMDRAPGGFGYQDGALTFPDAESRAIVAAMMNRLQHLEAAALDAQRRIDNRRSSTFRH